MPAKNVESFIENLSYRMHVDRKCLSTETSRIGRNLTFGTDLSLRQFLERDFSETSSDGEMEQFITCFERAVNDNGKSDAPAPRQEAASKRPTGRNIMGAPASPERSKLSWWEVAGAPDPQVVIGNEKASADDPSWRGLEVRRAEIIKNQTKKSLAGIGYV